MKPKPPRIISNQIAHGRDYEAPSRRRRSDAFDARRSRSDEWQLRGWTFQFDQNRERRIWTATVARQLRDEHRNRSARVMRFSVVPNVDSRYLPAGWAAVRQSPAAGRQSRFEGREILCRPTLARAGVPDGYNALGANHSRRRLPGRAGAICSQFGVPSFGSVAVWTVRHSRTLRRAPREMKPPQVGAPQR
jgi:hypothetical protein